MPAKQTKESILAELNASEREVMRTFFEQYKAPKSNDLFNWTFGEKIFVMMKLAKALNLDTDDFAGATDKDLPRILVKLIQEALEKDVMLPDGVWKALVGRKN